jgi:hypothetical protein
MLSTDEGYQRVVEAFVGNFTANIAASKLALNQQAVHNDSSIQNRFEPVKSRTRHVLEWPSILFIRTFCDIVSNKTLLEFFNH